MTASELVSKLDHVRPITGGWRARCPVHDDRNPSLSVTEANGKILLKCFAGCEAADIVDAVGLKLADSSR